MSNKKIENINRLPSITQLPEILVQKNCTGHEGSNRANKKDSQIRADNDYEAIQCWLDEYKNNSGTYRVYQREAERLLLWCIYQHKKPLSSLDKEDLKIYFDFLLDPQPTNFWCAPKGGYGKTRGSKDWKPFVRGLSLSARSTSIRVINSLLTYLYQAQYLKNNPMMLMRNKNRINESLEVNKIKRIERILEVEEWNAMLDTLKEYPEKTTHERDEKVRLTFLIKILYFLGIRISELEKSYWNAFRQVEGHWWFFVVGKGNRLGKVPVNNELLTAIKIYRNHMKLEPELPTPEENHPIITSWKKSKDSETPNALGVRYINHLLKNLAIETSKKFTDKPNKKEKLKKFSAHWLRHLSASMQDKMGIAFKHIKANHRHANDDTTRIYVHAFDDERHEAMQLLQLRCQEDLTSDKKTMEEEYEKELG